jgi:L,D-peptidoglycan transpeptidase YkuD (ErfK/YbiS/YcfS/YnhG family)
MGKSLRAIFVRAKPGHRSRGVVFAGALALPAALGRSGIRANKHEGDGSTPRGIFRPKRVWWRADRARPPRTFLPWRRIRKSDGWCENPAARHYNQPIFLLPNRPGDRLWRADGLYDLIIEIDHNTRPRVAHRGSAVFVHVARRNFDPTAGCIALNATTLRHLLSRISARTRFIIG